MDGQRNPVLPKDGFVNGSYILMIIWPEETSIIGTSPDSVPEQMNYPYECLKFNYLSETVTSVRIKIIAFSVLCRSWEKFPSLKMILPGCNNCNHIKT